MRSLVEDLAGDGGWNVLIGSEHRRVRASIRGDHDVVDAPGERIAPGVSIPAPQQPARQIEFENRAMLVGAREQERLLLRERETIVTAAGSEFSTVVVLPSLLESEPVVQATK